MQRLIPALLTTFAIVTMAMAEDVPLPIKKPRDSNGQPITSGANPVVDKSAKTARAWDTRTEGRAVPRADTTMLNGTTTADGMVKGGNPANKDRATGAKSAPAEKGKPTTGPTAAWPKTLDDAKAEAEAKSKPKPEATEWPAEEIAAEKAMCKTILDKIDVVAIPEAPFRKGECGAAAPVRLVSMGRNPEVVLSPPPILTCGMVGALHTWLTKDLQSLAKKHLGSELIKIESMSDYSCRNAYGRTKTKLSEHGRANALDIRGFLTANGEMAAVLEGWGETRRDIAVRELAAKKAAAAAAASAAQSAAKVGAAENSSASGGRDGENAQKVHSTGNIDGSSASKTPAEFGIAPSQLGGPDEPPQPPARMRKFLKGAHTGACKIFGTTLGPEANNAHRNHFHVDMAPRSRSNFCE